MVKVLDKGFIDVVDVMGSDKRGQCGARQLWKAQRGDDTR